MGPRAREIEGHGCSLSHSEPDLLLHSHAHSISHRPSRYSTLHYPTIPYPTHSRIGVYRASCLHMLPEQPAWPAARPDPTSVNVGCCNYCCCRACPSTPPHLALPCLALPSWLKCRRGGAASSVSTLVCVGQSVCLPSAFSSPLPPCHYTSICNPSPFAQLQCIYLAAVRARAHQGPASAIVPYE